MLLRKDLRQRMGYALCNLSNSNQLKIAPGLMVLPTKSCPSSYVATAPQYNSSNNFYVVGRAQHGH
jgi:hypothetical protein